MIHIVFQEADIAALAQSFPLDETLKGTIMIFKDDYAVGPITNIFSADGKQARLEWWKNVLSQSVYEGWEDSGKVTDDSTFMELTQMLDQNPQEEVWIWAAQNAHDVCGYYWLISQLKNYMGRIHILYLNNLPFINEKGHLFYPVNLFEIQSREFLKARKLARPVTPSEFEIDPDEWTKLCNEGSQVRILEGGKKIQGHGVDYFDKGLLEMVTGDWQKAQKIVHGFLARKKPATGDAFLLWRLRTMIEAGMLDSQGNPKIPKEFEVKRKVNQAENAPAPEDS